MRCIPFDEWFSKYAVQWMHENAGAYDMDRMEEQMPAVYERWLKTPAEWLSGVAPGAYFAQYTDAAMLVSWMLDYLRENVPVPDPLLNQITMLGADAERSLLSILTEQTASVDQSTSLADRHANEAQILAMSLLTELGSVAPMPLYIDLIANGSERDERVDHAAQALTAMGPTVVSPILDRVQSATRVGKEAFLDVLCNFPGEAAIFDLAVSLFESDPERRALYASLFGKLGDDRALDCLCRALNDPSLSYLDYIEIRNAIETLGGEAGEDRDFFGDPAYEALKRMK